MQADQYLEIESMLVTANETGLLSKADALHLSTLQAETAVAGLFSHGINSNNDQRTVSYSGLGDKQFVENRRIQITLHPSKNTEHRESLHLICRLIKPLSYLRVG